MNRIRTVSVPPARYPDTAPIVVPMMIAKAIAANPIVSDVRAPYTTRLYTSRKLPSVPKMCCGWSAGQPSMWMHDPSRFRTPCSMPRRLWFGSCVAITGAKTAMNTRKNRMIEPDDG